MFSNSFTRASRQKANCVARVFAGRHTAYCGDSICVVSVDGVYKLLGAVNIYSRDKDQMNSFR